MKTKGQAAFEFMYTYGWALAVIGISLGVLGYLFSIDLFIPNVCTIDEGFECSDYALQEDTLKIQARNIIGREATISSISCDYEGTAQSSTSGTGGAVPAGGVADLSCTFAAGVLPVGKKVGIDVTIKYKVVGDVYYSAAKGHVTATR